jgi:hypothetical protein
MMLSSQPEFDLQASLSVALGRVSSALEYESRWRQRVAQAVTQLDFAIGDSIPLTGGNGTLDVADKFAVKTGYIWSVRRLTARGWTAGTVTAYRNSILGEPVAPWTDPGGSAGGAVFTYGRGHQLLKPGDRLVFQAAGITGTVNLWGVADCFESWYLPFYIG